MFRRLPALLLCLLPVAAIFAAPAGPPEPADYNVQVRYRINAFRAERLRQYDELLAEMKAAGFVRAEEDPAPETEPDDPKATLMRGTIPAKGVKRLAAQRHVRSLVLTPKDAKLPDKGTPVRVDITIDSGYSQATQRNLARQTVEAYSKGAGFVEAVLYDHRGFSRIVGSVPVENLPILLDEPRKLVKDVEPPAPFRSLTGLRLVYVRADLPAPSSLPAPAKYTPAQLKYDPALRVLMADEAASGKVGRLEVILGYTPSCQDREWVKIVSLDGVAVEGQTGPVISVYGVPKDIAPKLADLRDVVAVRVPRAGRQAPVGPRGEMPPKWEPVQASGLGRLHSLGLRGKGTRIALVADDFAGWEKLRGRKDGKTVLPDPVLVDLTAARSRDVVGDPYPSAAKDVGMGHGTRCAMALLRAAPEAELTLVRIDAAAAYMVEEAARAINGESLTRSLALDLRYRDLQAERRSIETRGEDLLEERRQAYGDPREDDAPKKRRADYQQKQKQYDAEAVAFRARESRFLALLAEIKKLKGIRVVANALVWPDGYPVDGSSALSRYFDDKPFKAAMWFQAAGDTRGQAWTGLFRDCDGNGLMEFGDHKRLPAGSWSPEINFLGWQVATGEKPVRDLPGGAVIRVTLQWREAHDSLPLKAGDDVYREPLAKLKLVLVQQPDPDGKARPADDLDVVIQSSSLPQRLNQSLNSSTWEQVIEYRVAKPGRFGVFVSGKLPESTQAEGEVALPNTRKFGELRPRLFVNTLAGGGRAVWSDFTTDTASLGMPADARNVVTVGAADAKDRPRPASAAGAPLGIALMSKPDVLAYDDGGGTTEAASFAAGLAASSWGSRGALTGLIEKLCKRPGDVMRIPEPRSP